MVVEDEAIILQCLILYVENMGHTVVGYAMDGKEAVKVIEEQQPDMVLLMGGDNDIMLTGCADQAKSAMMAMIHQCAARGVKPVVGIQFPVLGIPEPWRAVCDWERAQAESAAYIAWLRRLVRAVSLRHVDFAEAFARCGGRALYQADGMHPNAEGNRVMAETVRRALRYPH